MTVESLKKVLTAEPFRPFTLHTASGRQLRVRHPELILFLGAGRTIAINDPKADTFDIVDLLLIDSLEFGAGNGSSARRRRAG